MYYTYSNFNYPQAPVRDIDALASYITCRNLKITLLINEVTVSATWPKKKQKRRYTLYIPPPNKKSDFVRTCIYN